MQKAIKTLEKRISDLNAKRKESEKEMEDPEMMCVYHFALADMENIELEILEHQQAINKLLNQ